MESLPPNDNEIVASAEPTLGLDRFLAPSRQFKLAADIYPEAAIGAKNPKEMNETKPEQKRCV